MISKIVSTLLPEGIHNYLRAKYTTIARSRKNTRKLKEWKEKGCPIPTPHIVKQMTITDYKKKYKHNILVETGTFMGAMVEAQKNRFQKIFSIELSPALWKEAKEKFKNDNHIEIIQGDSGKVLPSILTQINEPAIFWLDGHYSAGITAKGDKECPIYEELDAIFNSQKYNHVLLIDDARCFTGEGDYPTIEELTKYIKSKDDRYQIEIKHDIICYTIPLAN